MEDAQREIERLRLMVEVLTAELETYRTATDGDVMTYEMIAYSEHHDDDGRTHIQTVVRAADRSLYEFEWIMLGPLGVGQRAIIKRQKWKG